MIKAICTIFLFSELLMGLSATEIVRRGDSILRGNTQQSKMVMKIHRSSYTRMLTLRSWTVSPHDSLVEIIKPEKEVGIVSLRKKVDMWNYLPKSEQVVRIPTSMMLQSWMGSDFTNDDLMKLSSIVDNYTHRLIKSERQSGEDADKIECLPKPGSPVVWGKILYWARKKDSVPVREEYYDEKSQLVRTLTLEDFKTLDDRVLPTRLTIRKASAPDEFTEVLYEQSYFNRSIPDELFSVTGLKAVSINGRNLGDLWFGVIPGKT